MSKQALKRVRRIIGLSVNREEFPAHAWPGGYPIYYLFRDGTCICPACVNANIETIDADTRSKFGVSFELAAHGINYDDATITCDSCGDCIESAYGE